MLWTFTTVVGSYSYILVVIVPLVIISFLNPGGNIPHIIARYWARFSLLCAHVDVEVRGRENIVKGPAVYMPNHVSHFDVFALLGYLDIQFRWTVKKELFSIPLLGLAMKRAGYILIDRGRHYRAMESMRLASAKINAGTSIVIFPEGTRSCDGCLLYPLKKGGFHLASQAGVSIVPVTVIGSHEVLPKHGRKVKPGKIILNIGKPVDPHGKDVNALMEEVYNSIKLGYTL